MKRGRFVLAILVVISGVVLAYWYLSREPAFRGSVAEVESVPASEPRDAVADSLRRGLLGIWQDEYQGKRTMTLNEDGNATMLVELSGVQAILFASKLRFDMKWSVEGKVFRKRTVGGDPSEKVNLILNTMGDTAEDTILEATETRLLLLDKNGKTQYEWKRVK